jgi:hypothetical protein
MAPLHRFQKFLQFRMHVFGCRIQRRRRHRRSRFGDHLNRTGLSWRLDRLLGFDRHSNGGTVMKITAVRTHVLEAPIEQRFAFSQAWVDRRVGLVVEIETDTGRSVGATATGRPGRSPP